MIHSGIHNITGAFVNEDSSLQVKDKTYYCFSLVYPSKSRYYYLDNKSEYDRWVKVLKSAIKSETLLSKYELGVIAYIIFRKLLVRGSLEL